MSTPESSTFSITHKQAVRRIAAWLRIASTYPLNIKCSITFSELVTANMETPDVIGWNGGRSILVECKVSRADFFADKGKRFRKMEEIGMGDLRYFAAPKGMLKIEEIPDGWGLIELSARGCSIIRHSEPKQSNKAAEVRMLCSAIRRVEISTAVFVSPE